MQRNRSYTNKKVIISTHVYATGPAQALENYLKHKVAKLVYIGHPFIFAKETRSHIHRYSSGKEESTAFFPLVIKNQTLSLVKDILLTIFWVLQNGPADVYVGVDCFNASLGVILKKIGFVKKTVFYTIDYVPHRFSNKVMNDFYHALDTFSVKNSDSVWNLSRMMTIEREKKGIKGKDKEKQIVVPMGTDSQIKKIPFDRIKRYTAVHIGHLIQKQGMQLVIESMPEILKKFPSFHVDIIGSGDYEMELKRLAERYRVSQHITWYGFVKNHSDVDRMLARCAFGLAPYVNSKDTYTKFADPGKVKAYLGAHLPIIITKANAIADEVTKYRCGLAINYTKHAIIEACCRLLKEENLLKQMKRNTDIMSKNYRWDNIFSGALKNIL